MPPWQGGGDMILTVSFEKTTYNELPWKFEAGTPNMSGAVGLAAAMDYLEGLGVEAIAAHEQRLLQLATAELARSEEHTSELQSPCNLVCRLLLEKKKKKPSFASVASLTIPSHSSLL